MYPDMDIYQGYGMTEATGVSPSSRPPTTASGGDRLRSAGRPMPGVRFSDPGPEGDELPAGEIGEVCARGGNFMREYWNQPEATAEALRATAGTTPATPATSTRTATCSWSTG